MCGIAGCLGVRHGADLSHAVRMADSLTHRGPDEKGSWEDPARGVALAHRRLAVLDLTPAGHQPMASADGRLILVFNGEIYNHLTMRMALAEQGAAPDWKGHSDTETILAAISAWGLKKTLQTSRGMFAFGLWNRETKILTLARDRLGEKPIYYGKMGASFFFASELRAIRQIPDACLEIDPGSLSLMLRYGYVPSPRSIYRGINKLPPGTFLQVQANGTFEEPEAWWSLEKVIQKAKENPMKKGEDEAVQHLESLLVSAIREQMVADVPLGALLSGGIDSSTVVACMQAQGHRPVRTFTIGYEEKNYDEALHARKVARHLGTDHTEFRVTAEDALKVIRRLPEIYDEPFADASQIPTALVCSMARNQVTVALSGDGGDELFGGYNRHAWLPAVWDRLRWIPRGPRAGVAAGMRSIPVQWYDRVAGLVQGAMPRRWRVHQAGEKLHKLGEVLAVSNREEFYQAIVSQWRGPLPVRGGAEPSTLITKPTSWPRLRDFRETMMALDALTYLPDDILVKVDRAAMAASLEIRAPFLDERVVEFAWRLPVEMKIRHGVGKWILRRLLGRFVPPEMFERPKQGFAVPIDRWLRGPLRGWAEELFSVRNLASQPWLQGEEIRAIWQRHLAGQNLHYALWGVLMYLDWAGHRK